MLGALAFAGLGFLGGRLWEENNSDERVRDAEHTVQILNQQATDLIRGQKGFETATGVLVTTADRSVSFDVAKSETNPFADTCTVDYTVNGVNNLVLSLGKQITCTETIPTKK